MSPKLCPGEALTVSRPDEAPLRFSGVLKESDDPAVYQVGLDDGKVMTGPGNHLSPYSVSTDGFTMRLVKVLLNQGPASLLGLLALMLTYRDPLLLLSQLRESNRLAIREEQHHPPCNLV
jgi:hypothetical protein